jgi:hypothetical protein
MEMALTFILVFTIYTVAFELIPKPSPSFKYKADAKGLTLYSVSPQVCCSFAVEMTCTHLSFALTIVVDCFYSWTT